MRSESTLHIEPGHPALAGHFPGMPIVPGVVLLDAVVHEAHRLLHPRAPDDEHPGGAAGACQIGAAKFLSPVRPGETVTIALEVTAPGHARFELASGERKVATGTLAFGATP